MSATVALSELDPAENVQLIGQNPPTEAAESEIRTAWLAYQTVERHGLEFGRVCYEWQQKFTKQGSRTGLGLRPILDKVGVPKSTAYYWIDRYKESEGINTPQPAPKSPKPVQELKQLADAIPPIRNGKEFTPPSQYSAADIVETVTRFTDNLVNQPHLSTSDRKTVYRSVIREFQDVLAGMAS